MDELIALIEALCRIPAPSHQEDQRAEFIQKWLKEAGAKGVYIDEAKNVIYPVDEAGKDALSIFMAHTDTVFPDLTPFEPRTENGRMYCPGVGDDTANVAVLMMIARYAAQNGLKSPSGLVIAFNSCEEGLGNLKGCRALMERFQGRVGKVVSFDSGYDCVIARAVGSARYRVEVRTEGGHSFANFGNRNAIRYLSLLIDMLYAIKPPEKPGAHTTYNVGMIQGGTRALPVAMGGYGWARNNALLSDWPQDFASAQLLNPKKSSKEAPAALALPPDGDYLSYSGALIALLGRENTAPMPIEAREEAPYTAFSNGRVAVMPMTQREMRRMALLSESGKGPDYTLDADSVRFTDQLALLALPDTGFSDSPARKELALAFAAHLMTADCQQALSSVRAFPTIPLEQALYAGVSGYEEMEQALRSEELRVPTAFVNSWRASAKSLAEQALSGQISVQSAYLQFKALFPQPVSPVQTKN